MKAKAQGNKWHLVVSLWQELGEGMGQGSYWNRTILIIEVSCPGTALLQSKCERLGGETRNGWQQRVDASHGNG